MENTPTPTDMPLTLLERFNRWMRESIMVKLFSIGFLILILLIPSAWIESLITERQYRADEVTREVSDKWSRAQTVAGPILVIPYKKFEIVDKGKDGKEIREHIEKAYFLPEQLDIDGNLKPETRHRGIFDVVVYESSLQIKSTFTPPDFKSLSINPNDVLWPEAKLVFGISDLRGISDNPTLSVGGNTVVTEPMNNIGDARVQSNDGTSYDETENALSGTGIATRLHWTNQDSFTGEVVMNLSLKGSKRLYFVPAGKTTDVKLSGPWTDPSFDGGFLPDKSAISESGFSATWKILHFNRPFSQQWTSEDPQASHADFGVNLIVPVDQYQKSIRTAKYSILMILLTFIALFLVEITQKIRIHPFQYILIGAALIIYYALLLSVSEHLGFNIAYLIASLSTVILIALYSSTFLIKGSITSLFTLLLIVFYAFIFIIILQQDYSLLLGSVGLFVIVALLMYFSRRVKWYSESRA